jgi:hypothetical protein
MSKKNNIPSYIIFYKMYAIMTNGEMPFKIRKGSIYSEISYKRTLAVTRFLSA